MSREAMDLDETTTTTGEDDGEEVDHQDEEVGRNRDKQRDDDDDDDANNDNHSNAQNDDDDDADSVVVTDPVDPLMFLEQDLPGAEDEGNVAVVDDHDDDDDDDAAVQGFIVRRVGTNVKSEPEEIVIDDDDEDDDLQTGPPPNKIIKIGCAPTMAAVAQPATKRPSPSPTASGSTKTAAPAAPAASPATTLPPSFFVVPIGQNNGDGSQTPKMIKLVSLCTPQPALTQAKAPAPPQPPAPTGKEMARAEAESNPGSLWVPGLPTEPLPMPSMRKTRTKATTAAQKAWLKETKVLSNSLSMVHNSTQTEEDETVLTLAQEVERLKGSRRRPGSAVGTDPADDPQASVFAAQIKRMDFLLKTQTRELLKQSRELAAAQSELALLQKDLDGKRGFPIDPHSWLTSECNSGGQNKKEYCSYRLEYYTGLNDDKFNALLEWLGPDYPRSQTKMSRLSYSRTNKMSDASQLSLVLIKLRYGCTSPDLAHRFNQFRTFVDNIMRAWFAFLRDTFLSRRHLLFEGRGGGKSKSDDKSGGGADDADENGADDAGENRADGAGENGDDDGEGLHLILDYAGVRTGYDTPRESSPMAASWNIFVAATPAGKVAFISEPFDVSVRVHDAVVSSGFLDLLRAKDAVYAGKEFYELGPAIQDMKGATFHKVDYIYGMRRKKNPGEKLARFYRGKDVIVRLFEKIRTFHFLGRCRKNVTPPADKALFIIAHVADYVDGDREKTPKKSSMVPDNQEAAEDLLLKEFVPEEA